MKSRVHPYATPSLCIASTQFTEYEVGCKVELDKKVEKFNSVEGNYKNRFWLSGMHYSRIINICACSFRINQTKFGFLSKYLLIYQTSFQGIQVGKQNFQNTPTNILFYYPLNNWNTFFN